MFSFLLFTYIILSVCNVSEGCQKSDPNYPLNYCKLLYCYFIDLI